MRGPSPGGAAAGVTPSAAPRPSPAGEGGGGGGATERMLPTPWSTLRPWDGKGAQQAAAGTAGIAQEDHAADENQAGPPQCQQQGAAAAAPPEQQDGERPPSGGAAGSGGRRQRPAAAAAAAAAPAAAAGPTHGCVALTSVDAGVTDLARSAVRRLRGLRLCPEGREDGQVTHLVVGDERRTLKLMLAVANGAWLLSPQWVTASLEARRWLPESQFPAKVHDADVAMVGRGGGARWGSAAAAGGQEHVQALEQRGMACRSMHCLPASLA